MTVAAWLVPGAAGGDVARTFLQSADTGTN